MPDLEALGDAATGAVVSRVVEPAAGEADRHTDERYCLNCSAELIGDYCHACGQTAHVHRTLGAFWHDLAHSALHFEGKIWRTLPLLAWHPGVLTRRYIAGERARFVSPLALFLFSVFLMFAVFSLIGGPMDFDPNTPAEDRAEAQREIAAAREEARRDLARLERELSEARAAGQSTAAIQSGIRSIRTELAMEERAHAIALRLADAEERGDTEGSTAGNPDEPELTILSEKTGWARLDQAIDKAEKNPSLLLYKIQNNAYKFSWALIPISLPFVWLLFLHRRRYRQDYGAYDHLIFVTYSIAFMSLGAILLAVLRPLGVPEVILGTAFTFVPPIHIYRQLRGAYQLSRWSAVWRTFVLLIFSGIALMLFLFLLVALGVLG